MREDLTGRKYGKLTVIRFDRKVPCRGGANYYWVCKCDCGKEICTAASSLRGGIKSCGCLAKENHPRKHNMSKTRLFGIWHHMIQRCENSNCDSYKNYGARGISVCDEWHDSTTFFNWALANGYEEDLTIDRIDYNGNYEPSNCRWVGWDIQANNTRRNHRVTVNGETHTVAEWAKINHIQYQLVYVRVEKLGWSFEKAVTEPPQKSLTATVNGVTKTLLEWSEEIGCDVKSLYARKERGLSDYETITKPFRKSRKKVVNE